MVKLANRIEALKAQEADPENSDIPQDATLAADQSRLNPTGAVGADGQPEGRRQLSRAIKSAIFREVVLAKVREMKQQEETQRKTEEAAAQAQAAAAAAEAAQARRIH